MKPIHLLFSVVGIMLVFFASPASSEWLLDGMNTAQIRLVETNPDGGSAVLAAPSGVTAQARINDEVGTEQMTITAIRRNHIIVEKGKQKLRILLAPGAKESLDAPPGLAVPPGPPSN